MAEQTKVVVLVTPEKLPHERETSSLPTHHGPPLVVSDAELSQQSLDSLAHPANQNHRADSLLHLQQTYGNYYVTTAVAAYQARIAPKVTKTAPPDKRAVKSAGPSVDLATRAPTADTKTEAAGSKPLAPEEKGAEKTLRQGGGPAVRQGLAGKAPGKNGSGVTEMQAPGPAASMEQWKSQVHSAASKLKTEKINPAPQIARVRQSGTKVIDKHRTTTQNLPKDGNSAVTPPPKVVGAPPLIPPKVDPVPEATKVVEDASNKPLPPQSIPPLVESPQHNMPRIGPAPTPAPPVKQDDAQSKTDPKAKSDDTPGKKDPNQEQADKANSPLEAKEGPIHKGPGGEIVFEDKGGAPPAEPELPPAFQGGIAAALAHLMADPKSEANAILTQVRSSAYDGALQVEFKGIGKSSLDDLTDSLKSELDGIRKQAGISEEEINSAVEKRQKQIEQEKADAQAQVGSVGDGEKKKLADAGKDSLEVIAGTREQLDQATEDKLAQTKGDNDPEVVKLRRERLIHEAQKKVARQAVLYDKAGKKRHAEIEQLVSLQRIAYRNAVKLDEEKIKTLAGNPNAAMTWPWNITAANSRNWGDQQVRTLEQLLLDKGKETDKFVADLQKTAHDAGQTATEMIRSWADTKLHEHRGFWEKIWQIFSDWASQAQAETAAWEAARNQATRDAMVSDMSFLGGVVLTAGDELSEQALQNLQRLSAEQRAIVSTYYGLGADGKPLAGAKDAKNPIAAIAAGLRVRILQQRAPKILEQFDAELEKTPAADWEKLDRLGKAQRPGFSAAWVCSEVYEALHGGLTGWNDEPRVFRALSGLTKVQSLAARKLYSLAPSAGGYGKNLEEDLKDQLTGTFKSDHDWERAKAELEGDQTMAAVATLREAMHGGLTGWGTDEKAIMDTLRGKSAAERDKIKTLYKEKYGKDLEEDIKEELTGAFEDEHDYDRAQALLKGDTNQADAIAIDQAMYGGLTGIGTDRKAIEGVYEQVRQDVEKELQEEHQRTGKPPLTTQELEAEVRRRYEQIEASYNVTYASHWDSKDESGLRQAYQDELSDGELALVNAIADNDLTKADAARIQVEKESLLYADDDIINGVLKHQYERALEEIKRDKGPALDDDLEKRRAEAAKNGHPWDAYRLKQERHAVEKKLEMEARVKGKSYMNDLEQSYDMNFGVIGKGSFRYEIERNMSGYELQEARKRIAQGGWLTPAQQIHFATEGIGTKEGMFTQALEGKTKEEIDEIRKEWARMHPGESLEDRIESETSGRLKFELMHKLKGEPMSMKEEMEAMDDLVQHERDHDSSMFASDERKRLEFRYQEMQEKYAAANDPNLSDDERARRIAQFQDSAGYTNVSVQEHKESMEAVTNGLVTAVTTAIALVVAAVAIIFSGGTATPGVLAAFAAWASSAGGAAAIALGTAAVGIGIRQTMLGSDYGIEDMGIDLAVGGVDAVTAAATAGLSKIATSSAAELFAESMAKNVAKSEREAFKQAIIKALEENPEMAKRGILGTLAHSESPAVRMFGHGMSGAIFGAAGSVPSGAARTLLDSKTWEGGGVWEKLLQGSVGGIPQGALFGGVLGMAGGIRGPDALGKMPVSEEGVRPFGPKDVPPPGGHTSETLREGLPPDLQKKIPITVDPELASNTVRVHYEVDEAGLFKDIHIRAGPEATPHDIELHVRTVRTMQKYAGLQGRVRALIAKARAWVSRSGTLPGRRFIEAQIEVEKLPYIIEDHMARLAEPDLDPQLRGDLEADLAYRQEQLGENQAILDGTIAEGEARGYVAAEGRKKAAGVAPTDETAPAKARDNAVTGSKDTDAPTQAEGNSRAMKVADLSGKVAEAEAELARVEQRYDSKARRNAWLEEQIETAREEGRKPFRGYEQEYRDNERELRKLFEQQTRLRKQAFDAKSELNQLSGSAEDRAKWEEYKFSDLGSENTNPCFAPGTLVHTPAGLQKIEDLRIGDLVYVHDFDKASPAVGGVLNVTRGWTSHLQSVTVETDTVLATRRHLFWSAVRREWVEARKLWPGDLLFARESSSVAVSSNKVAFQASPTFNLEIAGTHNFFVGQIGLLVHNGRDDDVTTVTERVSKFTSGIRRPTRIYLVTKKNPVTGQWEPFYVGKTFQGEPGDVMKRFQQHLAEKGLWKNEFEKQGLRSEPIEEGNWTEFETAVWEEHFIRLYGGLQKENGRLVNARHELDVETYNKYRDGYAHNPCASR